MKIGVLAITLVVFAAASARGQKPFPSGCKGEAPNDCAILRNAAAEAELAKLYRGMVRADSGNSLKALRASQRAWVAYRLAHCNWVYHQWEGGTIAPMYYALCLETVARARIKQLRTDTADQSTEGSRGYPQ